MQVSSHLRPGERTPVRTPGAVGGREGLWVPEEQCEDGRLLTETPGGRHCPEGALETVMEEAEDRAPLCQRGGGTMAPGAHMARFSLQATDLVLLSPAPFQSPCLLLVVWRPGERGKPQKVSATQRRDNAHPTGTQCAFGSVPVCCLQRLPRARPTPRPE